MSGERRENKSSVDPVFNKCIRLANIRTYSIFKKHPPINICLPARYCKWAFRVALHGVRRKRCFVCQPVIFCQYFHPRKVWFTFVMFQFIRIIFERQLPAFLAPDFIFCFVFMSQLVSVKIVSKLGALLQVKTLKNVYCNFFKNINNKI